MFWVVRGQEPGSPTLRIKERSKMAFDIFERESARERLASLLRKAIFTGKLKAGERIVESQLAREMGVGQPTIIKDRKIKNKDDQSILCWFLQRGNEIAGKPGELTLGRKNPLTNSPRCI